MSVNSNILVLPIRYLDEVLDEWFKELAIAMEITPTENINVNS